VLVFYALFLLKYHMVAVILAGGGNTRYPTPKAFIEVHGAPIITRTLGVLKAVGIAPIVISTNSPELYESFGLRLISDTVKGKGPMGGIISVFEATGADELLVTACDMPFITQEVVQYILDNKGGLATVPVMHERPQPLLAVYTKDTVSQMRECLARGKGSLVGMVSDIKAKFLDEQAIRALDPEGNCFMNINTPEDREKI